MNNTITRFKPLVYLLKCALNNLKPDKKILLEIDFAELKQLCKFHGVTTMAASVILPADKELGFLDADIKKQWHFSNSRALGRAVHLKDETNRICAAFSKAGINYLKLKGIVISDYYPQIGMREMSDVDILIDNDKMPLAREIMSSFGYEATDIDMSNHDVFIKEPNLCFEIHEELFTDYHSNYYDYYIDCRERLVSSNTDTHDKRFTDEDFYIYNIAHSCKHLHDSGIGLRALTDIFVLKNKFSLNRDYIDRELKKLGLVKDEAILTSLSNKLFSNSEDTQIPALSREEEAVFEFMLKSGVIGNLEQSVKNQNPKYLYGEKDNLKNSKWLYIKSRIYPAPEYYKKSHPFFYRHKAARPFLIFVRLWDSVTHKKGKLKKELTMLSRIPKDDSQK